MAHAYSAIHFRSYRRPAPFFALGAFGTVLLGGFVAMIISIIIAIVKIPVFAGNKQGVIGYLFGAFLFGLPAYFGWLLFKWLSNKFSNSPEFIFWIGAVIGAFGALVVISQTIRATLAQTSGLELD